ncbi:2-phosphosulfolactate phosphatase [Paenibacillus chondroitinus]|uniref:Probable 2-phosphosulfolactate phosphatase n=1 Tax=Paenibacillus chondroitinus TaxID=59842 RepID=A0ABU6DMC8_9BACL|nr:MULTISPECIES: 2-phosphosulfolactate phosphatase [Paenibacillus]MCY9656993.1 2-phosphosulfolactate phosphatase [Paenibacillus anseongense]MEB4798789.1 2-phosphosulfolactate phosphatase [Paenibacillus chondroitinus]
MMHIEVVANIGEARSDDFLHKTVIVVDVIRATSTIITALINGCKAIVPVDTVLRAKELQQEGDLLGGERFCKKIPGFDFGNSPLEYTKEAVQGKRVILTTTNGTRGIQKAIKADQVLAGSFLNSKACAAAAIAFKRDTVILCAGTQDVFSLEDGLCAGHILEELILALGEKQIATNDFGLAMRGCFLQAQKTLYDTLLSSTNGKKMCKSGFQADIEACAKTNITDQVPVLERDQMVLLGTSGRPAF